MRFSVGAQEVVQVLLEWDATLDAADHLGDTPLHCAARLQVRGFGFWVLGFGFWGLGLGFHLRLLTQDASAATMCLSLLVQAGAAFDVLNNK